MDSEMTAEYGTPLTEGNITWERTQAPAARDNISIKYCENGVDIQIDPNERSLPMRILMVPIRMTIWCVAFYLRILKWLVPQKLTNLLLQARDWYIMFLQCRVLPFISKLMAIPFNVIIPFLLRQKWLTYMVPYAAWKPMVDFFTMEEFSMEEIQRQQELAKAGGILTSLMSCVVPYAIFDSALEVFVPSEVNPDETVRTKVRKVMENTVHESLLGKFTSSGRESASHGRC